MLDRVCYTTRATIDWAVRVRAGPVGNHIRFCVHPWQALLKGTQMDFKLLPAVKVALVACHFSRSTSAGVASIAAYANCGYRLPAGI